MRRTADQTHMSCWEPPELTLRTVAAFWIIVALLFVAAGVAVLWRLLP